MHRDTGQSFRQTRRLPRNDRSPAMKRRSEIRRNIYAHNSSQWENQRNSAAIYKTRDIRWHGKQFCFAPAICLTGDQALELYRWLDAAIRYRDGKLRPVQEAKIRWPRHVILREYRFVYKCQYCEFIASELDIMRSHEHCTARKNGLFR